MSEQEQDATWQVVEVTGVGAGELWFDPVSEGLTQQRAQQKARRNPRYIAIPQKEMPDDWGEQWLNGELEDDPYA